MAGPVTSVRSITATRQRAVRLLSADFAADWCARRAAGMTNRVGHIEVLVSPKACWPDATIEVAANDLPHTEPALSRPNIAPVAQDSLLLLGGQKIGFIRKLLQTQRCARGQV